MAHERILAIIQAGGTGGRLDVLTRERAKPALPFAGVYQLVDFPLSNLSHSGISDVWISVQFHGATLEEQLANGRPYDLDRSRGGLRLLMPEQGTGSMDEEGFARGNADELFRIRDQIRDFGAEAVLVLSADHVYRFDLSEAVATHRDNAAECTVVTTEVALADAGDHATVEHDEAGQVTVFDYKPEEPATGRRQSRRREPPGTRPGHARRAWVDRRCGCPHRGRGAVRTRHHSLTRAGAPSATGSTYLG
ncbi:hypothetical protein BH18ACT9_BH18ACT9_09710 [soil metagenome]